MFVITSFQTIFRIVCLGKFMTRYRTKSYTRSSNGPVIVVMKTEAEYKPCSRHFVVLHFTELFANLSYISPRIIHNL